MTGKKSDYKSIADTSKSCDSFGNGNKGLEMKQAFVVYCCWETISVLFAV
jgi:hypothetical protein